MEDCYDIDDAAVCELVRNCPCLTSVSLPRTATDTAVIALAKGCPNITILLMREAAVTYQGVATLGTHGRELHDLNMEACDNLTLRSGDEMLETEPL